MNRIRVAAECILNPEHARRRLAALGAAGEPFGRGRLVEPAATHRLCGPELGFSTEAGGREAYLHEIYLVPEMRNLLTP